MGESDSGEMISYEPEACPHCGRVESLLVIETTSDIFHVACKSCGCRGPSGNDIEEAQKLWNIRKTPWEDPDQHVINLMADLCVSKWIDEMIKNSNEHELIRASLGDYFRNIEIGDVLADAITDTLERRSDTLDSSYRELVRLKSGEHPN